jgi:hypothetical protein
LGLRVLVIFSGVAIDHMTEDQGIEQRENLVSGSQQKSGYK